MTSTFSLLANGRYSSGWIRPFYDQTGIWWGGQPDDPAEDTERVHIVTRYAGGPPRAILDLGTGPGNVAAAMADAGYDVLGVDLSPIRLQYALALAQSKRQGKLQFVEADFFTVRFDRRFDVVTIWDGFGLGSDADQRRLLHRVAQEWLAPGGVVLVDVFNPPKPARDAGTEVRLKALSGVPGSVEMLRRCHFDPVKSRWIDEWTPVENPAASLAQTVRCYSPADFLLLLEGTGLQLRAIEFEGQAIDWESDRVTDGGPLLEAWEYLAVLYKAE